MQYGFTSADAGPASLGVVYQQLLRQSIFLSFMDCFRVIGWLTVAMIPVVVLGASSRAAEALRQGIECYGDRANPDISALFHPGWTRFALRLRRCVTDELVSPLNEILHVRRVGMATIMLAPCKLAGHVPFIH